MFNEKSIVRIKFILLNIRDFVEIVVPVISFVILFLSFIYSIMARYLFKSPPSWGTEVQVASYIWTVLLGACYVRRLNKHVCFTMVYDMLSERGQIIIRIIRNIIMGVTYSILLKGSWTYIAKYRPMSPALRVPVKYYFFPIIILVFGVACYSFADVIKDIRRLKRGADKI